MNCSYEGCKRPVRSNGLCSPHYKQKKRTGKLKPLRDEVVEEVLTPEMVTKMWRRRMSRK